MSREVRNDHDPIKMLATPLATLRRSLGKPELLHEAHVTIYYAISNR